jgi:hypothetical protein
MANFWEGAGYSVINEFLSSFLHGKDGYAKASRYEVVIGLPKGFFKTENVNSNVARQVSLNCETIDFPGRQLTSKADLSTYGIEREIVYGQIFDDVSASFYVTTDHKEQKFFNDWQNIAASPADYNIGYYYDYVSSVDIYQLDERDTRRLGVRLVEAFPKTIGPLNVSYGSTNTIEKLTINFKYKHWEIIGGDAASSFLKRLANIAINQTERKLISKLPKVLTRL